MSLATDMQHKNVLITGAASGLGRAAAIAMATAGANVYLIDINADGLEETASLVADLMADKARCITAVVDISDASACQSAVDNVVNTLGGLDALCNVAGMIIFANSHEMTPDQWMRTLGVNLNGAYFLSRAAIPHLLEREGAIVNVASSAAFIGEAYAAAYCASKAGMIGMTKSMAMEYMQKPIRITAVAPGGMATNIATDLRPPEGANIDLIKRFSGMRGLVTVEEVAAMIVHLATPAGNAFHGTCVMMDTGITAG